MAFRRRKIIFSVPVMNDATLKQVKSLVLDCIKKGNSLTLMFHSIVDDTSHEDNWSWSTDKFTGLMDFLCEMRERNELDILTTHSLFMNLK